MSEHTVWTAKFYHPMAPGTRYHARIDCWTIPTDKHGRPHGVVAWMSADAAREEGHYACGYCCQPPDCCVSGRCKLSNDWAREDALARELGE